MFRRLCLVAILSFSSAPALAQIAINPDHPDTYVVQVGDTLWDISAVFLRDPWMWPEIWQINEQIANPHLIYPGDIVRLVYIDGEPQLVMGNGSGSTVAAARPRTDMQTIKLTPQMTSIPLDEAITSIPLDQIREFFTSNRVLTEEEIEVAPYMVAGQQERIMIGQEDSFYVRGPLTPGISIYQVFRVGERYRDPETREYLGYRAEFMGTARFELQSAEVSKFSITQSTQEVLAGDILLPLQQEDLDPILFPKVPDINIDARIISVEGGVTHIGQLDVVALNKGLDAGLENGHVMAVLDLGERVRDTVNGGRVALPDERAGMLIVFKSLPNMSFALILEAEQPLSVGDTVTNP
jgi:hypothetical protein